MLTYVWHCALSILASQKMCQDLASKYNFGMDVSERVY